MNKHNIPSDNDLPSAGQLVKSTILAICIATVLLITVVLPAEYGIDPTGVGSLTGLVKMGEIKASLAQEAAADKTGDKAPELHGIDEMVEALEGEASGGPNRDVRVDTMTFSLSPNEGKEIKLAMGKGEQVNYTWWTDGGKANYDTHADSKPLQIKYHNYEKGSTERGEGMIEAAFDGNHGWFWRNRTSDTMQVTLEVTGSYTEVIQY